MFEIFVRKRDGSARPYSGIATMSFSTSRILVTFNDGSIIRFNPGDVEEFKVLSNVRRFKAWQNEIANTGKH